MEALKSNVRHVGLKRIGNSAGKTLNQTDEMRNQTKHATE